MKTAKPECDLLKLNIIYDFFMNNYGSEDGLDKLKDELYVLELSLKDNKRILFRIVPHSVTKNKVRAKNTLYISNKPTEFFNENKRIKKFVEQLKNNMEKMAAKRKRRGMRERREVMGKLADTAINWREMLEIIRMKTPKGTNKVGVLLWADALEWAMRELRRMIETGRRRSFNLIDAREKEKPFYAESLKSRIETIKKIASYFFSSYGFEGTSQLTGIFFVTYYMIFFNISLDEIEAFALEINLKDLVLWIDNERPKQVVIQPTIFKAKL